MSTSSGYIASGLTAAAGGGIANALQISAAQSFSQVSVVANAGDSLKLPACAPGTTFFIRNDGANSLNLFPPTAAGQINAAGAGNALAVANGTTASVVAASNSALGAGGVQFYSYNAAAVAPIVSMPVITYAGGFTLTTGQTGSLIVIPNVATGTINLPAPVPAIAGNYFRAVCSGAVSNANQVIISAQTAGRLYGEVLSNNANPAVISANTSLAFGNGNGAAAIGDSFEFVCDGTNWYVRGLTAVANRVTIA